MKIPFKYSVDDDYNTTERIDIMLSDLDIPADEYEAVFERVREKGLWYRIELSCTLDTETGTITVEDVKV